MMLLCALSLIAAALLALSQLAAGAATAPSIPSTWPATDEVDKIEGSLLSAPLVQQALAIVNSIAPANFLSIRPSTYISGNAVTYNDNPTNACYFSATGCVRTSGAPGILPDIVSCPKSGQWGLTYDDGPTSNGGADDTPAILAALSKQNAKATFFAVGANIIQHPEILKQAYDAGHEIAVHTWTHHPLTSLTNEQVVAEIKYTEAIIYRTIGKVPAIFRPPYGDIDDRVRAIASALGYRAVMWNRDSRDADVVETAANAETVFGTINSWITSGDASPFISLEHDIEPFTCGIALRGLNAIASAKTAGTFKYTIQPVGTCLSIESYQAIEGSTNVTTTTTIVSATTIPATTVVYTARPATTGTASAPTASPTGAGSIRFRPVFAVLLLSIFLAVTFV
ncbi:hypothetical protein BJ742DRAFT_716930 [Cladochytrium replicatum]|nr:hypothetical protein BJ742DRAFT_716930 [Cladochytrium replicatum]